MPVSFPSPAICLLSCLLLDQSRWAWGPFLFLKINRDYAAKYRKMPGNAPTIHSLIKPKGQFIGLSKSPIKKAQKTPHANRPSLPSSQVTDWVQKTLMREKKPAFCDMETPPVFFMSNFLAWAPVYCSHAAMNSRIIQLIRLKLMDFRHFGTLWSW